MIRTLVTAVVGVVVLSTSPLLATGSKDLSTPHPLEKSLPQLWKQLNSSVVALHPYTPPKKNTHSSKPQLRPYLGVIWLKYPGVIRALDPASPAARAGVKPGDMLLAIDGKAVRTLAAYKKLITTYNPGDVVKVKFNHKGTVKTVTCRLKGKGLTFRERYEKKRREAIRGRRGKKGKIGTGVVLNHRGILITSTAISPGKGAKMEVTFADGFTTVAEEIERYPTKGYAILKMEKAHGTPIAIGAPNQAKLGQVVATLGNPYGSLHRVGQLAFSMGQISGHYNLTAGKYTGPVWETDAAIHTGNYGGPLVNRNGEMIGIVVPAYSTLRWLGVAIPVDSSDPVLTRLHQAPKKSLPTPSLGSLETAFQEGAKKAQPSVVLIKAGGWVQVKRKASNLLQKLLSRRSGRGGGNYYRRPQEPFCGVVVAPNLVLTSLSNTKVAKSMNVVDDQGTEVKATVVGTHQGLDLALLKVESKHLTPIKWADTKKLVVGQWSLAVGRHKNGPTINWGIISSLHRYDGEAFQASFRLNHGNLGGAVSDLEGRLLGISVRLSRRTGQSSGVSFFIPSHIIKKYLGEMEKGKDIQPPADPFLGIKLHDVTNEITHIGKNTPAQKVKLEVGDRLVSIGGHKVPHKFVLAQVMKKLKVGQKVKVVVDRAGQIITVELTLVPRPGPRNLYRESPKKKKDDKKKKSPPAKKQ